MLFIKLYEFENFPEVEINTISKSNITISNSYIITTKENKIKDVVLIFFNVNTKKNLNQVDVSNAFTEVEKVRSWRSTLTVNIICLFNIRLDRDIDSNRCINLKLLNIFII